MFEFGDKLSFNMNQKFPMLVTIASQAPLHVTHIVGIVKVANKLREKSLECKISKELENT